MQVTTATDLTTTVRVLRWMLSTGVLYEVRVPAADDLPDFTLYVPVQAELEGLEETEGETIATFFLPHSVIHALRMAASR